MFFAIEGAENSVFLEKTIFPYFHIEF